MSSRSDLAPVAMFVYRRLDHARRTIDALARNPEAPATDLIVYSDGPRDAFAAPQVDAIRNYLAGVIGFHSVTVIERPANLGLARSIVGGVTEVLEKFDRVIVVEDDLVTSPHFLRFMNDGLARYAGDDRVASIHGYLYPVAEPVPETFFVRGADCWGWATWRRGWQVFNPDGRFLLAELRRQGLTERFNLDGAVDYVGMLEGQIAGKNDSWAVRWLASAFLAGKLTLYPGRSLVHNIGNDSSGVHSGTSTMFDVALSATPIEVGGVPVEESEGARQAIVNFFRAHQPSPPRGIAGMLRRVIRRALRPFR